MRVDMIPFVKLSSALIAAGVLMSGCEGEANSAGKHTGDMVLALSWQPGFCETRPRLRECRSQKPGRFDTTHFSLHGLWPQPGSNSYCGVSETEVSRDKSRQWKALEALGLSDKIKQRLWTIMPGARSYLHRHEWVKHGTCYSKDANTYYADSIALMDAINASSVQDLFERSIGRTLTNRQIRRAFDEAFGAGVGARVRVACKRDFRRSGGRKKERIIVTELTLGLSGEIKEKPDIARLALASPETDPGCPAGIVDPVGLQ